MAHGQMNEEHPMRMNLELTNEGLLVWFTNHNTTRGVLKTSDIDYYFMNITSKNNDSNFLSFLLLYVTRPNEWGHPVRLKLTGIIELLIK